MSKLPVILTAFANTIDKNHLVYLEQEHDRLQQILAPLPYLRHVPLPSTKASQLVNTLTQYQKELLIFHFGGHADGDHLYFKDQAGQVPGLAENLSLHPQLKLLFLNGCNTQEQVISYINAGVPAVIATTCSIADGQAKQFADIFYSALTTGHTLQEAFIRAKGAMKLNAGAPELGEIVILRGLELEQEQLTDMPWRLYVQDEELLAWELKPSTNQDQTSNNSMLLNGEGVVGLQDIHNSQINITVHPRSSTIVEEPKNRPNNTLEFGTSIPHFVGREQSLADLYAGFEEDNLHVQILQGMLGMGKSRIAFEYVNTWLESNLYTDFIWWIDARNGRELIERELLVLFDRLHPHATDTPPLEKKERLFQWLRTHKSWLLIYLNAPAPDVLLGLIPDGEGHIIITSENPAWEGVFPRTRILKVLPLDEDNSMRLLEIRSAGKIDKKSAKNLVVTLGGYPFFLEQFAALYAENLLDADQLELYSEALAPLASKGLEQRRTVFLNLLFSVVGLGGQKIKIDIGTKEIIYFLRMMSPRRIPKDFIVNYGAHLINEFVDHFSPFWRFFLSPVFRWVKQRRAKITAQKLALLNRLAKHGLIWVDEQGLINMHILVHDFFYNEIIITLNSRVEKIFMANNCAEYAAAQFRIRTKKPETLESCKLLLPHMIAIAEFFRKKFGDVIYLDKLYERISDFFEHEQHVSNALHYAQQALDIQRSRKKDPDQNLVEQCLFLAITSGQVRVYDQLWSEFGQRYRFKEHVPIAQEALKQYWLMNPEKAAKLLEIALEKAGTDIEKNEVQAISLVIASLNAWRGSAQTETALNEEEEDMLNTYGEKSKEYAGVLLIKAEAWINHAQSSDDPDAVLMEANDFLEKARQILKDIGQNTSLLYWQTLILKLDCERLLFNPDTVQEIMELIEDNFEQIEYLFGHQHLSMATIKFNQAYLHQINGHKEACIQRLEEAIAICRSVFIDYPDHPILIAMEKVLEEINVE